MTGIDPSKINTNAAKIAKKLDAKDGKADGKIDKAVWNEFIGKIGTGKQVTNYIDVENARKSISTYEKRLNIGDHTWAEFGVEIDGETPPTASAPTASAPTASAPTASAPTASAPTASAPTASAPTASAPTASAPTASAPTASAPTASAPTASAPATSGNNGAKQSRVSVYDPATGNTYIADPNTKTVVTKKDGKVVDSRPMTPEEVELLSNPEQLKAQLSTPAFDLKKAEKAAKGMKTVKAVVDAQIDNRQKAQALVDKVVAAVSSDEADPSVKNYAASVARVLTDPKAANTTHSKAFDDVAKYQFTDEQKQALKETVGDGYNVVKLLNFDDDKIAELKGKLNPDTNGQPLTPEQVSARNEALTEIKAKIEGLLTPEKLKERNEAEAKAEQLRANISAQNDLIAELTRQNNEIKASTTPIGKNEETGEPIYPDAVAKAIKANDDNIKSAQDYIKATQQEAIKQLETVMKFDAMRAALCKIEKAITEFDDRAKLEEVYTARATKIAADDQNALDKASGKADKKQGKTTKKETRTGDGMTTKKSDIVAGRKKQSDKAATNQTKILADLSTKQNTVTDNEAQLKRLENAPSPFTVKAAALAPAPAEDAGKTDAAQAETNKAGAKSKKKAEPVKHQRSNGTSFSIDTKHHKITEYDADGNVATTRAMTKDEKKMSPEQLAAALEVVEAE